MAYPFPCSRWEASIRFLAFRHLPLESGTNLLWYPTFQSALRYNERDIWIWLPPTYLSDPERRYRTLYVTDGNEALTCSFAHKCALELIGEGEAEDAILVFVGFADPMQRVYEYSDLEGREAYAQFFVKELVPYIDGRFRTRTEASDRGITGVLLGGNFACYTAFNYPRVFGNAAGQGTAWEWNDWETLNMFKTSKKAKPVNLYVDSSYPTSPGRAPGQLRTDTAVGRSAPQTGVRGASRRAGRTAPRLAILEGAISGIVRWFAGHVAQSQEDTLGLGSASVNRPFPSIPQQTLRSGGSGRSVGSL